MSEELVKKLAADCGGTIKEVSALPDGSLAELLRVRGLLQRQWISVEERLPQEDSFVLCVTSDNVVRCCHYYEGGEGSGQKIFADPMMEMEFEAGEDVKLWQPFPEFYQTSIDVPKSRHSVKSTEETDKSGVEMGKVNRVDEKEFKERRKGWEWRTGGGQAKGYIAESGDGLFHAERRKAGRGGDVRDSRIANTEYKPVFWLENNHHGWSVMYSEPESASGKAAITGGGTEQAARVKCDVLNRLMENERIQLRACQGALRDILTDAIANALEQSGDYYKLPDGRWQKKAGSAETGGEKAAPQNDEHLPNLSDHCDECGHVRAKHEYGALGYNAASNCTLDDCDCPWWLEPNFPRPSQNQTVSSGVEGAHEGNTADKSGAASPELLPTQLPKEK